jgi:hypothetical protein
VAAVLASPRRFVPEKLHRLVTDRTGDAEDGIRLPVAAILTRAFHFYLQIFTTEGTEFTENIKLRIKNQNPKGIANKSFVSVIFKFGFNIFSVPSVVKCLTPKLPSYPPPGS